MVKPVSKKKAAAAEKVTAAKAANKRGDKEPTKAEVLTGIISTCTEKYGEGSIQRASEVSSSYLLRRPTGILSLDLGLAGGFPAAAPSVITGPDGVGKDYLLWLTMAETQRLYGKDSCLAMYLTEFKLDKRWMKDFCGFQIALSEDEIEELNTARVQAGKPELTNEEIDHYRNQIGEITTITGISADHGFDIIFKLLDANICQIIAVNSIGYLQTEAKEATESFEDFAQQRNEAALLNKALPKFSMYLNRGTLRGKPNETTLLLMNQVRSADQPKKPIPGRPVQEKDKYKSAVGAWALKHGKAIELFIHNGGKIYDEDTKELLGRHKTWELVKGKLGTHEGIKGEFDFFFGEGIDRLGDLYNVAVRFSILTCPKKGWTKYDEGSEYDFEIYGLWKVIEHLKKAPEVAEHLRARCLQEAEVLYRYT